MDDQCKYNIQIPITITLYYLLTLIIYECIITIIDVIFNHFNTM